MPKNREQLKQEYINSLDSFIAQNPKVGQLDTAKFRDFLIGLVEHESGFNPNAKQGSYFGWYQTNKLDADPYKQHMNAFNHLNGLFNNTITKADIKKARDIGISDAALMLKYWNQGNRVNNYIWNGKDSADGLGTLISNYGNDLTMPLDVYSYAMDNLYGNYTIKSGDNWFDIQKRVRIPGRNYATAGKDLWEMQKLAGVPYGSLNVGQKFEFGEDPRYHRPDINELINAWKENPFEATNMYGRFWDYIGKNQVSHKPKTFQYGGELIDAPFIYKYNQSMYNDSKNEILSFLNNYKSLDYSYFPVEPVAIHYPKLQDEPKQNSTSQPHKGVVEYTIPTSNNISTQTFHEEHTPSITKGVIEFKHDGIDVGNMQELIDLMQDEGISCRITSGNRPYSKTSSGHVSHHANGNALDITPVKGQTWDDLLNQMRRSKKFIDYMNAHGLGILDERSEAIQKKTGATGAHLHIGPDKIARTQFKYLIEPWKIT